MDITNWINRWEKNEIGFHQNDTNPFLQKYFDKLNLDKNATIFIPLCGKTLDINWLLSQNYKIVANELSQIAIEQFFQEINIKPTITQIDDFLLYESTNLKIFVGDFFNLTSKLIGRINAIYDRAAIVALPSNLRPLYSKHLITITNTSKQLVLTYTYDQKLRNAPPFSVPNAEIKTHYEKYYNITLLESFEIEGGLKGECKSLEEIYLLKDKLI